MEYWSDGIAVVRWREYNGFLGSFLDRRELVVGPGVVL
jgi:hypothetical protein